MKAGATEIFLFYGGSIDLAIYVGARLQNWVPVRIFEFKDKKENISADAQSPWRRMLLEWRRWPSS